MVLKDSVTEKKIEIFSPRNKDLNDKNKTYLFLCGVETPHVFDRDTAEGLGGKCSPEDSLPVFGV